MNIVYFPFERYHIDVDRLMKGDDSNKHRT